MQSFRQDLTFHGMPVICFLRIKPLEDKEYIYYITFEACNRLYNPCCSNELVVVRGYSKQHTEYHSGRPIGEQLGEHCKVNF